MHQELFTAGVDLCMTSLSARPPSNCVAGSIMDFAMKGKSLIPLEAMVKFVRIAHMYEQKDVMELLGERVIEATQVSSDSLLVSRGKGLQLMLAMELLASAQKKIREGPASKRGLSSTTYGGGKGKGDGTSAGKGSASVGGREGSVGKTSPPGGGGKVNGSAGKGGKGGGKGEGASPLGRTTSPLGRGSPSSGRKVSPKGGGKRENAGGSPKGRTGRRGSALPKGAAKEEGSGTGTADKATADKGVGGDSKVTDELETTPAEELHDVLVKVTHFLHFTLTSNPSLLLVDFDLLHDSLVMCWEVLRPALSTITTHDYHGCRPFLDNPTGTQVRK